MPQKGEFPIDLIKACFARLYYQCKFYVLDQDQTYKLVLQYRAKLKNVTSKKGKTKAIPKGREGLQIVLRAQTETFFVYVFTTVDWETGTIKLLDEGWVFTVDKRDSRRVCFYRKPLRRTKNYLDTLSEVAEAEKNRIDTMPCCDECKKKLSIKLIVLNEHSEIKKYGYILFCQNKKFTHKKSTFRNFYTDMDLIHRAVLEKSFEDYGKYQTRNEEADIPRKTSRDIRAKKTVNQGIHFVNEYADSAHSQNIYYNDGDPLE